MKNIFESVKFILENVKIVIFVVNKYIKYLLFRVYNTEELMIKAATAFFTDCHSSMPTVSLVWTIWVNQASWWSRPWLRSATATKWASLAPRRASASLIVNEKKLNTRTISILTLSVCPPPNPLHWDMFRTRYKTLKNVVKKKIIWKNFKNISITKWRINHSKFYSTLLKEQKNYKLSVAPMLK